MDDVGLSAGAVARRLGVAVTTLRTWHQRYGLGPSQHTAGRHRRYTAADLARLEVMRRLTAQGVPAAAAAQVALSPDPESTPAAPGRDGGGNAIPVGRADPDARGLARAAMRLDAASARALIERAVAERGVVDTWDRLLCPVLVGVGRRQAVTQRLVEVEHLLSRCISEVLGAVPRAGPGAAPRVLLACADEEQHSLPLEALAAALAERGVACRLLGARVPPRALRDAVRRTGPALVVVWSHAPETADVNVLRGLVSGRDSPAIAAAGPGWQAEALPVGVATPGTLTEGLALAMSAATR